MSAIIIGAGAAGLAAARDLSRAGIEVNVLEARDRAGGRVFTHIDPDCPAPIELGAEFVHGKSPELWQIAKAANLQIYETSESHWYIEGGRIAKSGEFWRKIETLMGEMKSSNDRSFEEFLDSLPDDEEMRRAKSMATRYVEGFHAADIKRIGTRGLVAANEAADEIDGDKAFRFVDGYDSLMRALRLEAESFGASVHLKTVVREVHWDGDRVKIVCGSDSSASKHKIFSASHVVITLPLGVLQQKGDEFGSVRFIPELPDDKRAAIDCLAMGDVLKVNLRFRDRFWEHLKIWDEDARPVDFSNGGFFHCPRAPLPTWWTQLPVRAPLLVGWTGGPNAGQFTRDVERSASCTSLVIDQAVTSLAAIFNLAPEEIRERLEDCYIHDWRNDPFSHGAYSYLPVNGLEEQQLLSRPLGNKLFFAGEATSAGHIGTVHGAIQSGLRAAKEILNQSQNTD